MRNGTYAALESYTETRTLRHGMIHGHSTRGYLEKTTPEDVERRDHERWMLIKAWMMRAVMDEEDYGGW
jgi:hypothetical protein